VLLPILTTLHYCNSGDFVTVDLIPLKISKERELIRLGLLTLLQPGPRDNTVQCFIKRDRTTSTYQLFLGLPPSMSCIPFCAFDL
jgi:hypothetical protein